MSLSISSESDIGVPADVVDAVAVRLLGLLAPRACLTAAPAIQRVNGSIRYLTLTAAETCIPIVLKVLPHGVRETAAFRVMADGGGPVAEMYGSFLTPDGREAMLLEHLPRIGLDGSDGEFGVFLQALARFNATPAPTLEATNGGWLQQWLRLTHGAWLRGRSGAWGERLAAAAAALDDAWPRIDRLADRIESELAAFPLDAIHQDPSYENCGWRQDGTLVFFDLAYVSRFPALHDLAICLGACNQPWPNQNGRRPWIEHYCRAYVEGGHRAIEVATAERGVELHHAASVFWLDERTFARADAALSADPAAAADHSWGVWFSRAWRRLGRMLDDGITAALTP